MGQDKAIKASITDIVRESLDERIWDIKNGREVLKKEVKKEILRRLYEGLRMRNFQRYDLWIKNIYLVGSLATLQFNETSDIDITVETDEPLLVEHSGYGVDAFEKLKELSSVISGEYYDKTLHVINYYFVKDTIDRANFDGIYDVVSDEWVKRYPKLKEGLSLEEIAPEFREKAITVAEILEDKINEVRRNLIDIQIIQDALGGFSEEKQKEIVDFLRKRIIEVEEEIDLLCSFYDELEEMRDKAFEMDEFDETGFLALRFSRAWLPPNIVYKFLERYNLILVLKLLKDAKKKNLGLERFKEILLMKGSE